ncbi:MAG: hypothetical protein Q4A16_00775 [Lautropia sp.]|nr:hypothetical protein [Lautropia sp.]
MSLLEETPASFASRPSLSNYLLPGLVLLNIWLMLALTGVLPPFFGGAPDPARLERQIDGDRVRILPAPIGDGNQTGAPGAAGQTAGPGVPDPSKEGKAPAATPGNEPAAATASESTAVETGPESRRRSGAGRQNGR